MKKNADILNELNSISRHVAEVSDDMPYQVPKGYFQQFPSMMADLIKKDNVLELSVDGEIPAQENVLEKKSRIPFDVPEGYFESFAGRMLDLVKKENEVHSELVELSAVLAGIPKTNPFWIPENYFENLQLNLPEKAEVRPVAKVIGFKTWKRIAVAALVSGIIFTGALFLFNKNGSGVPDPDSISISAMEKFLDTDDMDFPTTSVPETEDMALLDINEATIGSLLETVNDAAITEFMKENPGADISTSVN